MYSFYCRMYCCSSFLVFFKAYFFTRAGAGQKKKLEPEPVKNGPAPQHWLMFNSAEQFLKFDPTTKLSVAELESDPELVEVEPKLFETWIRSRSRSYLFNKCFLPSVLRMLG